MALLNILKYPDKRLNKVAKPVEVVDDRIRKLVADMAETMYAAPGVGRQQLERRHVKIFISRNTKGLPNGHVAGRSGKALPLHEQH